MKKDFGITDAGPQTGTPCAVSSVARLSPRQIQILRWLDENQSHRAYWNAEWTKFTISGETGSIIIADADNAALHDFITGCPTPDKIFAPNETGRAAIRAALGSGESK